MRRSIGRGLETGSLSTVPALDPTVRLDVLVKAIRLKPRMSGVLLLGITLFGLLLRIYRLDQLSFWYDEGLSAWMTVVPVWQWMGDTHPPLYYALLSVWRTWSDSDWWLRFLSVLFGTATIPVVYSLGKHMFDDSAGRWSATVLSALYIHVSYSQEARMYSLMVLLFACAFWGLVVGVREGLAVGWIAYTGSASLLAYTHGLGCVYVLVLAVLFPVITTSSRPRKTWRRWFLANSFVALLFCPYVLIYAQRIRGVAGDFWIRLESPEPPIFTTLFYSTVFPIPPMSKILAHLDVHLSPLFGQWMWFAPVVVVLALAVTCAPAENRWAVASLLLAYTLPIVLLSAISLVVSPVLIPRVLLPTVVPMVLMLGSFAALTSIRSLWRQMGLATVFIVLLVGDFYSFRYGAKEQWRQASHYLQEHVRSTDVVLINRGLGRFLVDRYDRQGVLRLVPKLAVDELMARCGQDEAPACIEAALRAFPRGQTVWLVEGHRLGWVGTSAERWLASHLEGQGKAEMYGVSVERTMLAN
jgi:4-amino-4-deoxy-L-arabinose transferase-like glycosyltransferase